MASLNIRYEKAHLSKSVQQACHSHCRKTQAKSAKAAEQDARAQWVYEDAHLSLWAL